MSFDSNEASGLTDLESDPNKLTNRINSLSTTPTTTPNILKRQSSAIKSNLNQIANTPQKNSNSKVFLSNNSKSSTYSSSSSNTSSSSSSSSSGSNESSIPVSLKNPLAKQKSTESTTSTATMTPTSSTSSLTKSFNIENELIKYTKNLLITNNYMTKYKLGDHIRNGGFSEIYEGNKLSSSDKVIVKLIPKHKTKNWLMVHNKKYPAEVLLHKMSANVNGVVKMLEFFEQDHEWVIIMPKMHNCVDLFDYLESKNRGRLLEQEACYFFRQLIKINLDLLNHGIVHRDIKSENILVELDTLKLILIDFGASAISRQNQNQVQFYTDFHGTRQYKPPEYIMHKKYTAQASTIWTLGILLYDMCNGQLPFETEKEILDYNLQMKANLSDEYKELLFDCLKQDPSHRPSLLQLFDYKWIKMHESYAPSSSDSSTEPDSGKN